MTPEVPKHMSQDSSQDPVARWIEAQDWPASETLASAQKSVQQSFRRTGGEGLLSFLHGDWLHEPLHSVLTDVPIGAWTVTVLSDALAACNESDTVNAAADISLKIGLAGALAAAVAGIADWSEIDKDAPRRTGAIHGLLNVGATALFAASWWMRGRNQSRSTARALSTAGYAITSLSAHLGGNLVYEHGVGVRSQREPSDLQPGEGPA